MRKRMPLARAAVAVAGAMLVGGLTLQVGVAQEDETVVFTYADTNEPSSLNPMTGYLATDFYFWAASYHLPITFGVEDLEAVPDLVTNVEVGEDGQTFTYTIRDDVTWSDGEPLEAEDVAYTLNMYKERHAYLPQTYVRLLDSIEATSPTTVVLHTSAPTSLYAGENPYMYTYILPEHVWRSLDKPKQYENVPMVGSGPFRVAEYRTGEFVRMEQNPHWTGPEPYVDEIIYRIFKSEDAMAEALKAGEIDFAYIDSPNIFESLADEPNIETFQGPIPEFDEIGVNAGSAYQEAEGRFKPHGDGHPALTDVTVRQAIRMAIDSQALVDKVKLGFGTAGTTIVPPVSIAGARWEPGPDELLAFDLEAANRLLDEAGYLDTDGDGVREMPQGSIDPGRPLEFRYYVQTNDTNTVKTAPFVQAWLEDIGIKTEVTAMTSGRLGDEILAGTYDLFHWGWIPDPDPDSQLSYFTCDERPPDAQTYANNDAYYCNPEYDRLYQEQRTTLDPETRLELLHEMQRIFYEDAAYSVLWYPPTLQAYRTDTFTGYLPQPSPEGDLLAGYSRDGFLSIRPVGLEPAEEEAAPETEAEAGTGAETRGLPPAAWGGIIGGGVLALVGGTLLIRRRRGAEDRM